MYAIDDESVDVDPFNSAKTIQLQDVVTHGIPNDKSFINHNLFTIGDGNDAIVERDSDEDDDDDDGGGVDDVFDVDGVVGKHAPAHSKFANFAFNNNEKVVTRPRIDNNKKTHNPSQIQMQPKQQQQQQQPPREEQQQQQHQQSKLDNDQNTEQVSHEGQPKATNNVVVPHSTNRQMTHKLSSKYIIQHSIALQSSGREEKIHESTAKIT